MHRHSAGVRRILASEVGRFLVVELGREKAVTIAEECVKAYPRPPWRAVVELSIIVADLMLRSEPGRLPGRCRFIGSDG